jgi:hypothetical protein
LLFNSVVHQRIIDITLSFYPLNIAPYHLLEIIDRIDECRIHKQHLKINLILNVNKSIEAVLKRRSPKDASKIDDVNNNNDDDNNNE